MRTWLLLVGIVGLAALGAPAPADALGVCPTYVIPSTRFEFPPDIGCDAAGSPGAGKITLVCWAVQRCPAGMDTCDNPIQLVQVTADTDKTKACKGTGYTAESLKTNIRAKKIPKNAEK